MDIIVFKALNDNFMYILLDKITNECAVIDPVEPSKLVDFAQSQNLSITHILTTHHHWDHAGGNNNLVSMLKNKVIVVGGDDRIESLNKKVFHKDVINVGNIEIECLFTPCHTTGHVCYLAKHLHDVQDYAVFTGDTLFIAGCGRFFEGTPVQMFHALIEILAVLPNTTKVYCGHEYTVKNLQFALTIEPNNKDIIEKLKWAQNQVSNGAFTVPSTISEELLTNPFMRVEQPGVKEACKADSSIKVMEILRKLKDNF